MVIQFSKLYQKFKKDFDLNRISEVYFWKSEWEHFEPSLPAENSVSIKYLVFRTLFMIYFACVNIAALTCWDEPSIHFIFLTNVSIFTQAIYGITFFIYLLWVSLCRRNFTPMISTVYYEQKPRLGLAEKFIWILINIVNVIPFEVTVGYWGFLYTPNPKWTSCQIANNNLTHVSNSVLALIDFMIIAVPIRRTHFIFPVLFGLSYSIFTILYEVSGGYYGSDNENIFSLIDWKNSPGKASLAVVLALTGAGIGHFVICYGLFRLKVYISHRIISND